MGTIFCHSGMLFGSVAALALVVTSIGGLSLLAGSVLRRAIRRPTNG